MHRSAVGLKAEVSFGATMPWAWMGFGVGRGNRRKETASPKSPVSHLFPALFFPASPAPFVSYFDWLLEVLAL